ncbi:MAG TPA: 50S ribosomal protein L3, partial [Elusimicrobiales bacterium]|nr:50S ribosomal protein L3 [Elusimicrobiales bacterium]
MTDENKKDAQSPQDGDKAPEAAAQPKTAGELPGSFKFIIGEKLGMTQLFDAEGSLMSASVVKAGPCRVVYTRTPDRDGYSAVCLGYGHKKEKNTPAGMKGVFKKLGVKPIRHLREFRVARTDGAEGGQTAGLAGRFQAGDWVDIQGVSKGKGFAGGMKRHNFAGQPASHGASDRERAPGSLASRRSLGRVLPGQRMAGHLGQEKLTIHKVKVVKVVPEENLIFLNGPVPGAAGTMVSIMQTVKKTPKPPAQTKKSARKEAVKASKPAPA